MPGTGAGGRDTGAQHLLLVVCGVTFSGGQKGREFPAWVVETHGNGSLLTNAVNEAGTCSLGVSPPECRPLSRLLGARRALSRGCTDWAFWAPGAHRVWRGAEVPTGRPPCQLGRAPRGPQGAGTWQRLERQAGELGQSGSTAAWKAGRGVRADPPSEPQHGPSRAEAPGTLGSPPPRAGQHQGVTTHQSSLPPAALSLSLPECQSGPLWSRPGCQLGHARYKTRGPLWVSGWGRGHLHVSTSLILNGPLQGQLAKALSIVQWGEHGGVRFHSRSRLPPFFVPEVLPSLLFILEYGWPCPDLWSLWSLGREMCVGIASLYRD